MAKFTISQIDLMTDLLCLQKGIIHYAVCMSEEKGSIDAALSSLDPEQARIAKRKFRKLIRRKIYSPMRPPSRKRMRVDVMVKMRSLAWNLVQNKIGDNDPD